MLDCGIYYKIAQCVRKRIKHQAEAGFMYFHVGIIILDGEAFKDILHYIF